MGVSIISRLRKLFSIIKHKSDYTSGPTYYPGCDHKTPARILMDQLRCYWKHGYVEEYYYTYGFDRLEMSRERMEEYIVPYRAFLHKIDHLNFQNPYYNEFLGKMTCRVINQDKFYFYLFLSRLMIATPKVLFYMKNKQFLYVDDSMRVDKTKELRAQLIQLLSYEMDAFAKPADGMMGEGVFRLQIKNSIPYINGMESNVDNLMEVLLSADYILQETIAQDERMSALCSSSVNTIRIQTVMDRNGNVIPFGAMIRIGREGCHVDNWAKGGIIVGIKDNGKLMEMGYFKPKYGTTTTKHPDNNLVFKDYEIPYYQEAVQKAIELHKFMYRNHSIGWDIAITKNGPVFIEGNDRWEISMAQAVHGGLGYLGKYF